MFLYLLPYCKQQIVACGKSCVNGIQDLVDEYRLNDAVPGPDINNAVKSKKKLIAEKERELEKLNVQKMKQYDLLEQGIYTTEVFLERSNSIASSINSCQDSIE